MLVRSCDDSLGAMVVALGWRYGFVNLEMGKSWVEFWLMDLWTGREVLER